MNLDTARDAVIQAVTTGRAIQCPCCDRRVSRYRRRIHAEMAKFLCDLVRLTFEKEQEWIHVDLLRPKNGNYSMLRLWGLAEPSSKRTAYANAHGLWRVTPEGLRFARKACTVSKYLFLWNGRVIGRSEDQVTIHDCLGTRFSYAELMGGAA